MTEKQFLGDGLNKVVVEHLQKWSKEEGKHIMDDYIEKMVRDEKRVEKLQSDLEAYIAKVEVLRFDELRFQLLLDECKLQLGVCRINLDKIGLKLIDLETRCQLEKKEE